MVKHEKISFLKLDFRKTDFLSNVFMFHGNNLDNVGRNFTPQKDFHQIVIFI
jgi:hypothetical protein